MSSTNLISPRLEAREKLSMQLHEGSGLRDSLLADPGHYKRIQDEYEAWVSKTKGILKQIFDNDEQANFFSSSSLVAFARGDDPKADFRELRNDLNYRIERLSDMIAKLDSYPDLTVGIAGLLRRGRQWAIRILKVFWTPILKIFRYPATAVFVSILLAVAGYLFVNKPTQSTILPPMLNPTPVIKVAPTSTLSSLPTIQPSIPYTIQPILTTSHPTLSLTIVSVIPTMTGMITSVKTISASTTNTP